MGSGALKFMVCMLSVVRKIVIGAKLLTLICSQSIKTSGFKRNQFLLIFFVGDEPLLSSLLPNWT